jgi:hypothetical protein
MEPPHIAHATAIPKEPFKSQELPMVQSIDLFLIRFSGSLVRPIKYAHPYSIGMTGKCTIIHTSIL